MHYRKTNILIHRYLGYFFFGLTVVYSISGLAVNHMDDWNPNYIAKVETITIQPLKNKEDISKEEILSIFKNLKIEKAYKEDNIFYPSEELIQIILSSNEKVNINTSNNKVSHEFITRRPILKAFNFLHLNEPKKGWTYYADFYAISLLILAISGMFMKKGKEGIWGKGGILALAGMIIPLVFIFMYY